MASEHGSIFSLAPKQPASLNSTTPKKEHIPHFDSEDHLRQTIAALLTRLPNHRNVQIAHGPLEKGKDIIFSVPIGFNRTQHCACVVKDTPITASHTAKANLSTALSQVRKAFTSPFLDSNAHEAFISKCFLICPHEISWLAQTCLSMSAAPMSPLCEKTQTPTSMESAPAPAYINVNVCASRAQSVDRIIYAIFNRFNEDWQNHTQELFTHFTKRG